jgi:hypothetical protein
MDANYTVRCDLDALIERALRSADIAFFRHPQRDSVYAEAKACVTLGKDDPSVIASQMARYRAAGHRRSPGLVATGVIVRRHTPALREFGERWWAELDAGSHRDQLSAPYVLRRTGLRHAELGADPWRSDLFAYRPHDEPEAGGS